MLDDHENAAMQAPMVSIVMPAYNHAKYVERGIKSVLDQNYAPLELIVIDDGSRDDTWATIQRVQRESKTAFTALTQPNAGVCKTLNRGIALARGEFIAVIASDDYFLPGKVAAQVACFAAASPRVALVHTSAFLDYQNGRSLEDLTGSYRPATGACFDDMLTQAVRVVAPSMMFRRSAWEALGGFDERLAAEDVDFFLRLAAEGYEFAYVPHALMVKTVVEGSGGSQLRTLIRVHEQILEKHAHRLSPARYAALRTLMYRHLIQLAAGAGDYRLSFETAVNLSRYQLAVEPLLDFAGSSARAAVLRALPTSVRHALRLARSQMRVLWPR